MNRRIMFSTESSEWGTNRDFFKTYDRLFHFNLDVCATKENTKCRTFIDPITDALTVDWHKHEVFWHKRNRWAWMNPPYGNAINLVKLQHDHPKLYAASYYRGEDGKLKFQAKIFRKIEPKIARAYTTSAEQWIAKAYQESLHGLNMVCLLPARTDTNWFHQYARHRCTNADCERRSQNKGRVQFIPGRLVFDGTSDDAAPFPNLVLTFRSPK